MQAQLEQWMADLELLDLGLFTLVLSADLIRNLVTKRMSWRQAGDMLANLSTQIPFTLVGLLAIGLTLIAYYGLHALAPAQLPVNGWTMAAILLLADFVYYWEHRVAHRVRLLWMNHAVHHSSPYMNASVGFRFGPFESFMPILFHAPLCLLGFDPLLVILAQIAVLSYQTWIHTEVIGKLGWFDRIFNSPANHRVHHGSNDNCLDRNFGGILILWDRIFGTYQAEEETPVYGLTQQINSINPLKICFSEWPALFRDLASAASWKDRMGYLFRPPGWEPAPVTEKYRTEP